MPKRPRGSAKALGEESECRNRCNSSNSSTLNGVAGILVCLGISGFIHVRRVFPSVGASPVLVHI